MLAWVLDLSLLRYQKIVSPENFPYENTLVSTFPLMKAPPCENYSPEICSRENCSLGKLPPMKSPPHL